MFARRKPNQEASLIEQQTLSDEWVEYRMQGKSRHWLLPALVLLSVLAGALVIYTTRWGAWAGSDSAAYLATARSLASGSGFRVLKPSGEPAILMPPLYPLLLAVLNITGIPMLEAARWVGVVLFGLTILITGLFYLRLSHTPWLAIPAGALLLTFPAMLRMYSGIMSEALFLALGLASLFLLVAYLSNGSRHWLVAAGFAGALATLARFIGGALLPLAVLLLFFQQKPVKRRMSDILIFFLVFAVPTLAWAVWYLQNAPAALEMARWSDPWEYLSPVRAGLVNVFWGWLPFQEALPPQRYLVKFALLSLIGLGTLGITAWLGFRLHGRDGRRWIADRDLRLFTASALFVILYLLVFALIYLFRFPPQDVDERTLLPVFPALVLVLFSTASLLVRQLSTARSPGWVVTLPGVLLLLGLAAFLPHSLALAGQIHKEGEGYTRASWRDSQTIRAVQELPPDVPIISNDTGAILFFTGRMAIEIKEIFRSEPLPQFTRFGDNPDDSAQALFREGEAALVLFYPSFFWHLHALYQDETEQRMEAFVEGLPAYGEFPDGAIYFYPSGQ